MITIDETALDQLRALNGTDDNDFALEMLEFFMSRIADTEKWMKALDHSQDYKEALTHFHSLKSSTAAIGLLDISKSAAILEALVRSHKYSDCPLEYNNLKDLYSKSCDVVKLYITSAKNK